MAIEVTNTNEQCLDKIRNLVFCINVNSKHLTAVNHIQTKFEVDNEKK